MSLITRNSLVLIEKEVTYGTDPAPTVAANEVEVENLQVNMNPQIISRSNLMGGTLSPASPLVGRKFAEVSFSTELKGSGAAGTAPDHGVCLVGCGFSETVQALTDVTYAPASGTAVSSVTLWCYLDGKLYKVNGARGTGTLRLVPGDRGMWDWTFQGFAVDPIDAAMVTPTFEATVPTAIKNMTATVDAYAAKWSSFTLDIGNTIIATDDPNDAEGYGSFEIIGREMTGRFDPEAVLMAEAGHDYWANFEGSVEQALSFILGSADNRMTMTGAGLVFTGWNEGDRGGLRINDLPFQMGRAVGDDELSIVWD